MNEEIDYLTIFGKPKLAIDFFILKAIANGNFEPSKDFNLEELSLEDKKNIERDIFNKTKDDIKMINFIESLKKKGKK